GFATVDAARADWPALLLFRRVRRRDSRGWLRAISRYVAARPVTSRHSDRDRDRTATVTVTVTVTRLTHSRLPVSSRQRFARGAARETLPA
ncbi:hypothetical protein, partial [Burkholderia pseudomallei]|uniref:hypothetical protein n=1 Tax=Burkholderia pseudomallei TaxID=28450 RepID=UPI0011AF146C